MLLLFLALAVSVNGVFLPLYSYHRAQCFLTKQVQSGGTITGSYEISGSNEGMNFHMLSPLNIFYVEVVVSLQHPTTDAPVWSSRALADHFKHTVTASGQYNLCFKQTMNKGRQTASFQLHVTGELDLYDDSTGNIASRNQAEKVGHLAGQIETQAFDLLDHQDYAITRESLHRETAESTNSRVLWWSLAQMTVLITLAVVQMYYIKSFFEIKLIV